jgi:hypothetical protein
MMSISAVRMAPFHEWDRNLFLIILAVIWFGILAGFIPDVLAHMAGGHVPFAPIVHVHAAFYLGWLVLLTAQMSLVRSRRVGLHRRLGLLAVVMIPAMAILGPWTGIVMGRREFGTPDGDPQLLSVIFLDALNFTVIASSGLILRADAVAHRRLMMLATIFITGAGFGRWLGAPVAKLMGGGPVAFYLENYSAVLILVVGMVLYDLRTRGRLHPLVAAAMAFGLTDNWLACFLHELPAWKAISDHLLGH